MTISQQGAPAALALVSKRAASVVYDTNWRQKIRRTQKRTAIFKCRSYVAEKIAALARKLLAELRNAMREPRNFAAGGIFVNDVTLRCTHDHRLRRLEGF